MKIPFKLSFLLNSWGIGCFGWIWNSYSHPSPFYVFTWIIVDVSCQLFHPLCDKQYSVIERVLGPKSRDVLRSSCHTAVIQPVRVSVSLNAKCMIGPNDLQSPIQLYSQSPVRSPFSGKSITVHFFSQGPHTATVQPSFKLDHCGPSLGHSTLLF